MHVQLEPLLEPDVSAALRVQLERADGAWRPGAETAGNYARQVKHNEQLDRDAPLFAALAAQVIDALQANALFKAVAMPMAIHSLLFSRCGVGQGYGRHVDNAFMPGGRADLSFTLFLSDPSAYSGGELVLELPQGDHAVRLPAGHAVLYPSSYLHRVAAVGSGVRYAAVGWVQSAVRSVEQRELLFELDTACRTLAAKHGRSDELDLLYRAQTNLLRMWGG
ncbi:MAG: hypothetical protein RLZZ336_225 [Cyanobacteriota bacterium]|jgi:PKHD-type hydroxylase